MPEGKGTYGTKQGRPSKKNNPHSTTADAEITLRKSPTKQKPKLRQGKKTPAEHMQEIKSRNLKGMKDNYLRALDILTTPAMATGAYAAGKGLAKLVTSEKSMKFLSGLVPGIITRKGRRDYPEAEAAFKAGEGQPKVRQSIPELQDILGKHPKRFKDIDMDELDRGAAQAVLNPKNKEDKYLGKLVKAWKLTLAEVFEAVKNKINIKSVDVLKTNRELNRVLGKHKRGAGSGQYERTMGKGKKGIFNTEHTEELKRIARKKKREK